MFDTERLVPRHLSQTDLEDILGLWNEPLVLQGLTVNNDIPPSRNSPKRSVD
jgi:hypothetical protein